MTAALTSMAILKINADRYQQDTLDNFLPMVADRLYYSASDVVALTDLRKAVGDEYGLWIPLGVLSSITRRAARKKLVKRVAGEYLIDRDAVKEYDLQTTRARVRRAHMLVISAGVNFLKEHFERHISEADFEIALDRYIQKSSAPLLSAVVDSRRIAVDPGLGSPEDDVMVARFISELDDRSPELFGHLSDVVKGSILATALYFPSQVTLSQKLTGLQVFLDTKLLLRAVGACGSDLQEVSSEIVALCIAQGARVRCFRHSVDEMRGILRHCMLAVKSATVANGEASEYMVSEGWEYSDVVQLDDELDERLSHVGITVVERPDHEERLTLDEDALESLLQDKVGYRNPEARRKDVDSISAVFRLRKGEQSARLAKARAIFVTTNFSFVRAVREYERIEQSDRETVPLCTYDYLLTTILWLMRPMEAPDLPIRSLVADSYATMRTDDAKWAQYVSKMESLRTAAEISPEQVTLLRTSLDARALILVETKMDPGSFTVGTAQSVLRKYRDNLTSEARAEARVAKGRVDEIERRLTHRQQDAMAQVAARERIIRAKERQIERNADSLAKIASIALLSIAVIATVVGAIFGLPRFATNRPAGVAGALTSACVALFFALGLLNVLTGRGLPWAQTWLKARLTTRIERWLQGSDDDGAS